MEILRQVTSIGIVSSDDINLLDYVGNELGYTMRFTVFPNMFVLKSWLDTRPDSEYKQQLLRIFADYAVYDFSSILLVDISNKNIFKD